MTKLKTLEYRLFRKIREKLRNFSEAYHNGNGKADPIHKYKGFQEES